MSIELFTKEAFLSLARKAGMALEDTDLEQLSRRKIIIPLGHNRVGKRPPADYQEPQFSRLHLYFLARYFDAVRMVRHPWRHDASTTQLGDVSEEVRRFSKIGERFGEVETPAGLGSRGRGSRGTTSSASAGSEQGRQVEPWEECIEGVEAYLVQINPWGSLSCVLDIAHPEAIASLKGESRLYAELRVLPDILRGLSESNDPPAPQSEVAQQVAQSDSRSPSVNLKRESEGATEVDVSQRSRGASVGDQRGIASSPSSAPADSKKQSMAKLDRSEGTAASLFEEISEVMVPNDVDDLESLPAYRAISEVEASDAVVLIDEPTSDEISDPITADLGLLSEETVERPSQETADGHRLNDDSQELLDQASNKSQDSRFDSLQEVTGGEELEGLPSIDTQRSSSSNESSQAFYELEVVDHHSESEEDASSAQVEAGSGPSPAGRAEKEPDDIRSEGESESPRLRNAQASTKGTQSTEGASHAGSLPPLPEDRARPSARSSTPQRTRSEAESEAQISETESEDWDTSSLPIKVNTDGFQRALNSPTMRIEALQKKLQKLQGGPALPSGQMAQENATEAEAARRELASQIAQLNQMREKYLEQKNWNALVELYEEGIQLFEDPRERQQVYLTLGMLFERKIENLERALQHFQSALEMGGPRDAKVKALEGVRRTATKAFGDAYYGNWLEARMADAEDDETRRLLQGDFAIALHQRGEYERAFLLFAAFLADRPDEHVNDQSLHALEILAEPIESEELEVFYDDVLEQQMESKTWALLASRAAALLQRRGDIERAISLMRKAREKAPQHTQVIARLAELYEAKRDWKAILALVDAWEDSTGRTLIEGDLDQVVERALTAQMDQSEDVLAHYQRRFEEHPGDSRGIHRLIRAFRHGDRAAEGYAYFKHHLDQIDDAEIKAEICARLGEMAWRDLDAPEEATIHFRQALENVAQHDRAMQGLVALCAEQGEWDQVIKLTEERLGHRSVLAKETVADWLMWGARAAERLGRHLERNSYLEQVLALRPNDEEAWKLFRGI